MRRRLLRRPVPRRKPRRKWPLLAAALALAALFWLWPRDRAPDPPPPAPTAPVVRAAAVAAVKPVARKPPPPPAHNPLPAREALLAAVRERASTLRDCALPGGALARLPLRLHVGRSGEMRSVDFTGDPPPDRIASCVRKAALRWTFESIPLSSDVELLVSVSFAPGS